MLLTDVKTDEMYKIIINICLEICKNHVQQKKAQEEIKYPETEELWREKDQNCKKMQRSTNHETKENVQIRSKKLKTNKKNQ